MDRIPADPGTYVLLLRARSSRTLQVGRLGVMRLRRGYYAYVGSALGPGGLRARLAHHLRVHLKPHWHLDYVRPSLAPVEIWFSIGRRCLEHVWANRLLSLPDVDVPLLRFGASDCRCAGHFIYSARKSRLTRNFLTHEHPTRNAQASIGCVRYRRKDWEELCETT